MSSFAGTRRGRNHRSGRSRELLRYGIVAGAILAGAFYLFTESAGISLLWDVIDKALRRQQTDVVTAELYRRPLTAVTLTPRPPEILP